VSARTFEVALQVLHHIMPFITEALWRRFPGRPPAATITTSRWPRPDRRAPNRGAEQDFALVQELVSAIRQLRAEYAVEPGRSVNVRVSREHPAIVEETGTVLRLAKVGTLTFGDPLPEPGANAILADGTAVYIALGELVDVARECRRLGDELDRLNGLIESQHTRLANAQFTARAPATVVQRERDRLSAGEQACHPGETGQLGCR
jgi:valyl-tRNA synthetase